jgi:hypothetical protein
VVEDLFQASAIKDDLLRMIFSCCDPRLREGVRVALVLHILCGFSVNEIASAFFSSHAAIEKRITRGKKVLAGSKRLFDLAMPDLPAPLDRPALGDCALGRGTPAFLFSAGGGGQGAKAVYFKKVAPSGRDGIVAGR